MLGVGVSADRQAVGGERRSTDDRNPGQGGQDLAVAAGEQRFQVRLERGDVGLQRLVPSEVTAQPSGALLSIGRRWQAAAPPLRPVLARPLG